MLSTRSPRAPTASGSPNERIASSSPGSWIELPVMDAFELRDGKICAWRDYFDLAQFQRQTVPDEGAA